MVCWGLYTLLDCNCNLKGFRCCSIFPPPFLAQKKSLQDQRGNSRDFSVLELEMVQPVLVPVGKSSDEWENRNAAL
ncbi:hypothetical protein CEXT_632701 [Caerostris extrusa]|uniref:Uncharacterized protein n=1 Tax=Caerostris extrusa TaxID=172846 RepID=A0AAV4MF06_CAEEX|nr:hypothetical protein CEXT_632701 [Caerostris extrusa]